MKGSTTRLALIALTSAAFLAACSGSPAASPTAALAAAAGTDDGTVTAAGYGPGGGLCGTACTGTVAVGPADLPVILAAAVQEEYKAQMLYRSVILHQGEAPPFSLIVQAEVQHVAALQLLFTRRGWTTPASAWTPEQFPQFATLADACAAGATAEREDAEFYTPHLQRSDLPSDVRTVLTNLQAASLENHLPAFERCR